MVSFLITAWKEEGTVGKAIKCAVDPSYSGYKGEFEVLVAAPDDLTISAVNKVAKELGIEDKLEIIKDPCKGKPVALNILFKEAKGDILVLTDGEVFFRTGATKALVDEINKDDKVGGVSGRPVALNDRKNYFGYLAHMNADAVHAMRTDNAKAHIKFFPLSGYAMAVRNLKFEFPEDLFLDDAYLTYDIFNKGYHIGYAPDAEVEVKYTDNWKDFRMQKLRSHMGFEQLWKYQIIKPETKSRSFWKEIRFVWFPIKYASNIKEFFFSLSYYPIRLYFWVRTRFKRDFVMRARSIRDVYVRTESTK